MARLIDADALKEFIGNDTILKSNICRMVDAQPTAYDVEKVIAELEIERKTAYCTYESFENKVDLGIAFGVENAIEIVRKGGVE